MCEIDTKVSNNEEREREREGNNHVRYNMASLVHLDPLDILDL